MDPAPPEPGARGPVVVMRGADDLDGVQSLIAVIPGFVDPYCLFNEENVNRFQVAPNGENLVVVTDTGAFLVATADPSSSLLFAGSVEEAVILDSWVALRVPNGNGFDLVLVDFERNQTNLTNGTGTVTLMERSPATDRLVFRWNPDDPDHHLPYSTDCAGNVVQLATTQRAPGQTLFTRFTVSPTTNSCMLRIDDPSDDSLQYYEGPCDGSGAFEQLSPAPGATGDVRISGVYAPDGRSAYWQQTGPFGARELYTMNFLDRVGRQVSADGGDSPGAMDIESGGVLFREGAGLYFGDAAATRFLASVPLIVPRLDLSPDGAHAAWITQASSGADQVLHVADTSGVTPPFLNVLQAPRVDVNLAGDPAAAFRDDPDTGRDVYADLDLTNGTVDPQYLMGQDEDLDTSFIPLVGGGFLRIENIGSDGVETHTLSFVVSNQRVTPGVFDFDSAVEVDAPLPGLSVPSCRRTLLPTITYDPTDPGQIPTYSRGGVYVQDKGLVDWDFGRLFINNARVVGDPAAVPLQIDGTNPAFPITYQVSVTPFGNIGEIDGTYQDANGLRNVSSAPISSLATAVSVRPDGPVKNTIGQGALFSRRGRKFLQTTNGQIYLVR